MKLVVRLAILAATAAVLVKVVRSRRAVEVWHMAADVPPEGASVATKESTQGP